LWFIDPKVILPQHLNCNSNLLYNKYCFCTIYYDAFALWMELFGEFLYYILLCICIVDGTIWWIFVLYITIHLHCGWNYSVNNVFFSFWLLHFIISQFHHYMLYWYFFFVQIFFSLYILMSSKCLIKNQNIIRAQFNGI